MTCGNDREKMKKVYGILQKKGYNPINQIVGFIITGDPTYITSKDGARTMVSGMDSDELLHDIVSYYFADQNHT